MSDAIPPEPPSAWRVMRMDDNGNVFEMVRVESASEAEAIAEQFQRRGHKQLYWIEAA